MDAESSRDSRSGTQTSWAAKLRKAAGLIVSHTKKHIGVGVICSVAYFDPGNWGVDLQAGSQFGYRLLFVVLLASLFAILLQVLASRLGCVTGKDLATHCRLLLYNRRTNPRLKRWLLLYPLYALSEIAIISTDLAELLGSAIGLCMIFPKLPLWAGVLITSFDVILILAMGNPLRSRPLRYFEFLIAFLVLAVMVCMIVIVSKIYIQWDDVFMGFVPSKYIFKAGGLYTSIGIVGATVMPHSLFLGSALATQDRVSPGPSKEDELCDAETLVEAQPQHARRFSPTRLLTALRDGFKARPSRVVKPNRYSECENNSHQFVRAHLYHAVIDVAGSLIGFAFLINSMILVIASAVFFYGSQSGKGVVPAGLFDAHALIREIVGKPAAFLFAIALLSSGQSASLIATIAGQTVCEGFLNWKVTPALRRLITRLLSVIPSMTVAIAVGPSGIDALLVASQVVLSILLPFIMVPLVYCTSSKKIMRVKKSSEGGEEGSAEEYVDYSNGKIITGLSILVGVVIVAANVYVIVMLARGKSG